MLAICRTPTLVVSLARVRVVDKTPSRVSVGWLSAGTACRASEIAQTPLITAGQCDACAGSVWWVASRQLRRCVLHQRSHLGAKTRRRVHFHRCCLVVHMQKVKPFAPNFNRYVDSVDCPAAPQDSHGRRDCRGCAGLPKGVICEGQNDGSEFDGAGLLRRCRGTTRLKAPAGPPPACWSIKRAYAPELMTIS